MQKFDQATFNAYGEAGVTREESLDQVHQFYENQGKTLYRDGVIKGFTNLKILLISLGTIILVSGVVGGIGYAAHSDYLENQRYMTACKSGDSVVCLEGVQDQFRQAKLAEERSHGDFFESDTVEAQRKINAALPFNDRANQLLLAYRQKTGQVLPAK